MNREPGPPEEVEGSGSFGHGGHRRRRRARRLAIDILYQADVMAQAPSAVLEAWRAAGRAVPEYTEQLVRGVESRGAEIDRALGAHAEGWAVHRMAVVDRTILRVASYEMRAGVPVAVAINEAVDAARELSTEDSGRFINGVLGRVATDDSGADPPSADSRSAEA